jgi:hypothetical protein
MTIEIGGDIRLERLADLYASDPQVQAHAPSPTVRGRALV